jgi:hypothetical protein
MHTRFPQLSGLFVLLALVLALGGGRAQVGAAAPFVRLTNEVIDYPACKAWIDDQPTPGDFTAGIRIALGLGGGRDGWGVGRHDEGQARTYLLVFKEPVAIGTVLFQSGGTLKYLKADAALPPNPATKEAWTDIAFPGAQSGGRAVALPPGTTTRALLINCSRTWGNWYRVSFLRLLSPRLHNVTPEAVANGEAEYISFGQLRPPIPFTAANIVRGAGSWQSHGPASEEEYINRAPVSEQFPTWFVVSWDVPKTLNALYLNSNFKRHRLLAYKGPAGMNPTVGGEDDWEPLKAASVVDGGGRWFFFPGTTTRGLKFIATDTGERFGRIDGLQVYTDLQDAPVPARAASVDAPPCQITVHVPADGIVTVAIDDAKGRRVRNLVAREERKAGPYTLGWDLKDERGQVVQPGTYRWKALYHPGLTQQYQMTPYPNIGMTAPGNSPWQNGHSGPGGWLADHSSPRAVCPAGEKIFFSSACAESGVALIECDLQGRKSWGHHNIIAWTGPSFMASDGKSLYTAPWTGGGTDYIWRFSLPDKRMDTMLQLNATATRRRGIRGLAVRDGQLIMAINASDNWLDNAITSADVDLERSVPRYAPAPKTNKHDDPDPRADFLRLFRLTGTPPGCKGLITLDTAKGNEARQHLVLTLNKPSPIGSFAFPFPDDKGVRVRLSVLKATAPYPPVARRDADWTEVWAGKGSGWTVIPALPNTVTRAVRISFDHGEADIVEEGASERSDDPEAAMEEDDVPRVPYSWQGRLEGMKILRRRFANLFPTCKVTVNSGTVNAEGEWDAKRTTPITADAPGIYMMEWATPQAMRGLAIKEIDGKRTEIDAWAGPAGAPVDLNAAGHWEQLTAYEQPTRYYYQPDQNNNALARYVDGYVDFGRTVTTRALRLRVVEQWLWKGEGRDGCAGVRRDRGGEELNPLRCRIYGVAPLQYLGEEPPVDTLATDRLEIYDTTTKALVREVALEAPGDLVFSPTGALYAASGKQVVQVDLVEGKHRPLPLVVGWPAALACDKAGNLYIFDSAKDQRVIKVFTPAGKLLRAIGVPGGRTVGAWNPAQFTSSPHVAVDLAIDAQEQLWVVEADRTPKRISRWTLDGKHQQDYLGNTEYGGGGCLDPVDKSRLYYGPMEFALDWTTGNTRINRITWQGDSPAGEYPIHLGGRRYLVTRPQFGRQTVGVVYLEEGGRLKRVAAMGYAGHFDPLRQSAVLNKLGATPLGYCAFLWSDRNGDGDPQPDEVTFTPLPGQERRGASVGYFEETLAIDGHLARYEVTEILPNGTPIYATVKKPVPALALRLKDGSYFAIGESPNRGFMTDGAYRWSYPSEGWGVHALNSAKPYQRGQVVAEFDVVGRAVAHAGDLGEFVVTNSNTSIWNIWTADGLLAGQLFRDQRGPRTTPWSMREHERGLDLTHVTPGQEHFAGYFCKTADNRYYAVAGHNHISVVEVLGLEKFKRLGGDIPVTGPDLEKAIAWNRAQLSRGVYEAAKQIVCRPAVNAIAIDGDPGDWNFESARLKDRDVTFAMTYDDENLYLCVTGRGVGPMLNTGNDWRRLFKTGAAVDLQIGVNPAAPMDRKNPAVGDLRLLMTLNNDKPIAVLYQPNAPKSKPEDQWETHTGVFHAGFDRVVLAPEVAVKVQHGKEGYCLEAAIPLKLLGLTITPELRLKMDWGILESGPKGTEVLQRRYWANGLTAIISDEAAEAMLHPDLWGMVRFAEKSARADEPELD